MPEGGPRSPPRSRRPRDVDATVTGRFAAAEYERRVELEGVSNPTACRIRRRVESDGVIRRRARLALGADLVLGDQLLHRQTHGLGVGIERRRDLLSAL